MQEGSTELPHLAWIGFLFLHSFGVLDISQRERERASDYYQALLVDFTSEMGKTMEYTKDHNHSCFKAHCGY